METISSIELENFKGYCLPESGEACKFDFSVEGNDADIILITGQNGVGKTSLLEAMDMVLNQTDLITKEYLTTDKVDGCVRVNNECFNLEGQGKTNKKKLNTVGSFFYQENIAELACDEIIQLLEPENKPGQIIRQSLKELQKHAEGWQRIIQSRKYRKNYDEERKLYAGKINSIVKNMSVASKIRRVFEGATLTLNNGNLQSKWESQVRNLTASLGELCAIVEPVVIDLSGQLEFISECLFEYKTDNADSVTEERSGDKYTKQFLTNIQSISGDLGVCLSDVDSNESDEIDNKLFLNAEIYASAISSLEVKKDQLTSKYQNLNRSIFRLQDGNDSLDGWINNYRRNIDSWVEIWDECEDGSAVYILKEKLESQIDDLADLSIKRLQKIRTELNDITKDGQDVAAKLNKYKHYQTIVNDINNYSTSLSELLEKEDVRVIDIVDYVKKNMVGSEEANQVPGVADELYENDASSIRDLGNVFVEWHKLELEKIQDDEVVADIGDLDRAENMVEGLLAIIKRESGARSQMLSVVDVIPQAELESLLATMNSLLSNFHFPDHFLPIKLHNYGTEKNPKWAFKTDDDVLFDSLSTGQKSQLAICWTINLNMALADDVLGHKVIAFDDFTTSLDMNQLIPAAVLIRKIAYADEQDDVKRQVFITSHHEDLTNKLLDFLLPPSGKRMKVIKFENWSKESGPDFRSYNVDMGYVQQQGLEDAIKRVAKNI
jgi:energy-coupling factor transporter ATP-binding protein EcfA2